MREHSGRPRKRYHGTFRRYTYRGEDPAERSGLSVFLRAPRAADPLAVDTLTAELMQVWGSLEPMPNRMIVRQETVTRLLRSYGSDFLGVHVWMERDRWKVRRLTKRGG